MIVLTDADEVLENLGEVWVELLNETYGTHVSFGDIREWDMCSAFPGLTRGQVYGMEMDERIYGRMKPKDGAAECLQKIISKGHELYVVTDTPYQILKPKMDNVLFKYYPFLTWKNFIITSNKKLIRGDVLIDDGLHNLVGAPYKKILMSAPYNLDFDAEKNGMIRVDNWKEVETALESLGIL
jgi:5'(3')-deoxyribonucleotidase